MIKFVSVLGILLIIAISGFTGANAQEVTGKTRDSELKVINFKILVNGNLVAGGDQTGGVSGAVIWFYLPDRGRFIISTTSHPCYDFQSIGWLENNKISFTLDGNYYEWISSSPVIGTGESINLWILPDKDYIPKLYDKDMLLPKNIIREGGTSNDTKVNLVIGTADKIDHCSL